MKLNKQAKLVKDEEVVQVWKESVWSGYWPNFMYGWVKAELIEGMENVWPIKNPVSTWCDLLGRLGVTPLDEGTKKFTLDELNIVYQDLVQRDEAWKRIRESLILVEIDAHETQIITVEETPNDSNTIMSDADADDDVVVEILNDIDDFDTKKTFQLKISEFMKKRKKPDTPSPPSSRILRNKDLPPLIFGGSSANIFFGLKTREGIQFSTDNGYSEWDEGSNKDFILMLKGEKFVFTFDIYVIMGPGQHLEDVTTFTLSHYSENPINPDQPHFQGYHFYQVGCRIWKHPRLPIYHISSPDGLYYDSIKKEWGILEYKWPAFYFPAGDGDDDERKFKYRKRNVWKQVPLKYGMQLLWEMRAFGLETLLFVCSTTNGHRVWSVKYSKRLEKISDDMEEWAYMKYWVKGAPIYDDSHIYAECPYAEDFYNELLRFCTQSEIVADLPTVKGAQDPKYKTFFFDDENGKDRRINEPDLFGVSIEHVIKQMKSDIKSMPVDDLETKITSFFQMKEINK